MPKKFAKLIAALKSVRLKDDEKAQMREVLMEYTQHKPVEAPMQAAQPSPFFYNTWLRRAVPVALILLVVFAGTGKTTRLSVDLPQAMMPGGEGSEVRSELSAVSEGASISLPPIDVPAMKIEESKSFETTADAGFSVGDDSADALAPTVVAEKEELYVGSGVSQKSLVIEPYVVPGGVDITDTREFLKTSYGATIQARDVSETVEEVEDAVRRVDGRIDSSQSSDKHGQVAFAIPKSELEKFRDDIAEITHAKLYVEEITSENLLGQKQDIEQREDDLETSIDSYEDRRASISASHTQKLAEIRSQMGAAQQQLTAIRNALRTVDDEDFAAIQELLRQEQFFQERIQALMEAEKVEKSNYAAADSVLAQRIDGAETSLEGVQEEDADLRGEVATVQGHVSVRWISLWDMAEVFSPTPMALNVVAIVVLLWWWWERAARRRQFDLA